jgi:putative redox protein
MASMTGEYMGLLRTQNVHLKSGNTLITDAPPDNKGKGEAFSPTDLVCAALSSCMMTTMGIEAEKDGIDLRGIKTEITKIMAANPRRIQEIQITLSHPGLQITETQKEKLKHIALHCPVALSLSDNLKQTIVFNF